MNQLIKIRQISDYDIDAASSVEQIAYVIKRNSNGMPSISFVHPS